MMTPAYDQTLLYKARITLAWMFEHGVNTYHIELDEFYRRFINSGVAALFSVGSPSTVAGRSGAELAYEVVSYADPSIEMIRPINSIDRSAEYWLGFSLAYYQWKKNISFTQISNKVPMSELILLYPKYHEMDIEHFVIQVDSMLSESTNESQLKRLRAYAMLSQSMLAKKANIPVRTIQQYEQGQKDLSHANSEYIIRLSKALYCKPEDLL